MRSISSLILPAFASSRPRSSASYARAGYFIHGLLWTLARHWRSSMYKIYRTSKSYNEHDSKQSRKILNICCPLTEVIIIEMTIQYFLFLSNLVCLNDECIFIVFVIFWSSTLTLVFVSIRLVTLVWGQLDLQWNFKANYIYELRILAIQVKTNRKNLVRSPSKFFCAISYLATFILLDFVHSTHVEFVYCCVGIVPRKQRHVVKADINEGQYGRYTSNTAFRRQSKL